MRRELDRIVRRWSSGDRPATSGQAGARLEGLPLSLEAEIMGEMASALGRAERKVTTSLERLAKLDVAIAELEARHAEGRATRRELCEQVELFNRERDNANQRLWELMVHREAIGLYRHAILEQFYPIPPRKRAP